MTTTHKIPFTRFVPPTGRRQPDEFGADAEMFSNWEKVRDAGFRMTVEMLRTGQISLCIEDSNLGDFDCVVTPNGPELVEGVRLMLSRFTKEKAAAWRATFK